MIYNRCKQILSNHKVKVFCVMRSQKVTTTTLVDRKKLKKVKKNWVTVSLISFSILGVGGLTVADQYASADGTTQSSTNSSSNININAVPASVDTVSASVSQAGAAVKSPGSAQIYNINLTNSNPYGAIIPKGTVIKITFNSPAETDLSKELSFSGLNAAGSLANNYSANFSGNTLTITTTADQYPSSQNLQAIFNLSDPGWNWDNSNNAETPNNFNITANAEFIYQGNSLTSNFKASNLNFAIAPTPKATAEQSNTDNPTPGYQQGFADSGIPTVASYPQGSKGYVSNTQGGQSASVYNPTVLSAAGNPYFVTEAVYNQAADKNFSGSKIELKSSNIPFDANNVYFYKETDSSTGTTFEDITHADGVNISISADGLTLTADFSNSAYTHSIVKLIAYQPFSNLSQVPNYNYGWLTWIHNGKTYTQYISQGSAYTVLNPVNANGHAWFVAPDTTVDLDQNQQVNFDPKSGIQAFNGLDNSAISADKINVTNLNGYPSDGQGPLAAGDYQITYQIANSDGSTTTVSRTIHVVKRYETATTTSNRSVTVSYQDANGNQLKPDVSQNVTYLITGTKDIQTNSWVGDSTAVVSSGSASYSFISPSVSGYHSPSQETVAGTLAFDPSQPDNVHIIVTYQKDDIDTVTTSLTRKVTVSYQDAEGNTLAADQNQSVTYTVTEQKDRQTGEVIGTPTVAVSDGQADYSFASPAVTGYHSPSQATVAGTLSYDPNADSNQKIVVTYQKDDVKDVVTSFTRNVTIHYQDGNGQTLAPSQSQAVTYSVATPTDVQTGQAVGNPSATVSSGQADYSFVSPAVTGYHAPSQATVAGNLSYDPSANVNQDVVVTYQKDDIDTTTSTLTRKITVSYQDSEGNTLAPDQSQDVTYTITKQTDHQTGAVVNDATTVTAGKADYSFASPEVSGYHAPSQATVTGTLSYDPNANTDQKVVVTYRKDDVQNVITHFTRKVAVNYQDQNGHILAPSQSQEVTYTISTPTDVQTGKAVGTPTISVESGKADYSFTSPAIDGYHSPSQATVAGTLTYDLTADTNQNIIVEYQQDAVAPSQTNTDGVVRSDESQGNDDVIESSSVTSGLPETGSKSQKNDDAEAALALGISALLAGFFLTKKNKR